MKSMILALLLTSCATTYGPLGHSAVYGGHTTNSVGKNKYMVSYYGNNFSSLASIQGMAFRRVEEVCAEMGKEDFEIINQESRDGVGQSKSYEVTFSCN